MKKFGNWKVSSKGKITYLNGEYVISENRLLEDWENHLREKDLIDLQMNDFMSAYIYAVSRQLRGFYVELMRRDRFNFKEEKYYSNLDSLKKIREKLANIYKGRFGYLVKEESGRVFPVVFREKGKNEALPCLFCGAEHIHSLGEGHRATHCSRTGSGVEQILEIESEKYDMDHGYVVVDF